MISTPYTAFRWLLGLGLEPEQAMRLCESREKFEYYVEVLRTLVDELS